MDGQQVKLNQDMLPGDKVFVTRKGDCTFQRSEDYGDHRCLRYVFTHDFDGHEVFLYADPTALAGRAQYPKV